MIFIISGLVYKHEWTTQTQSSTKARTVQEAQTQDREQSQKYAGRNGQKKGGVLFGRTLNRRLP